MRPPKLEAPYFTQRTDVLLQPQVEDGEWEEFVEWIEERYSKWKPCKWSINLYLYWKKEVHHRR